MSWTVYKHTAPNGMIYIGITSQPCYKRWRKGKGYQHNYHFYSAIKEFGWDNIQHEIVCTNVSQEEAQRMEIELITKYKSDCREFGYNIECGGLLHDKVSEETRKKLSDINKGKFVGVNHPNYGKRLTEEQRERISRLTKIAMKNLPEESRRKMIETSKRNKGKKGKPQTAVQREKNRIAHLGKGAIKVTKIDRATGEKTIYSSAKEAQDITGISRAHIASVCKGYRKSAGGYLWQYT